MTDKKISQLTAGTPPYAAGTLFEVAVPDGGGGYNTRSARQDGLSFTLGATQIALSSTAPTVAGLTLTGASVWHGGTVAVLYGGTGQTTYTNGQLLIGNTAGNTLAKGTLTAPASGIAITNGAGSITFSLNDDLAALEALSSTGMAARTATSTWALRTLTGTANRLTVTQGNGVAGNPILDISAAYVGQASITTLGIITAGEWRGTVVAGLYGGTGVANSGKTITLGGNLVTSGAFATTITVTAATNSTLPAGTHTLAGLDVAQTWTANQIFSPATITTLTLAGVTTFPGSGQITATGEFGIRSPATSVITVGGTYTTANSSIAIIGTTLASSLTTTQVGLNLVPTFTPTGASLGSLRGVQATLTVGAGAVSITNFFGNLTTMAVAAGYSGVITNVRVFNAADITWGNSDYARTTAIQYGANVFTNADGATSGTITNRQFLAQGITASAAGATINNRGIEITLPSGGARPPAPRITAASTLPAMAARRAAAPSTISRSSAIAPPPAP